MSVDKDFTQDVLCAILKDYALSGAEAFKKLPDDVQQKALKKLRHRVMLSERDIRYKMSRLDKEPLVQFLPAPVDGANGFRFAFFQPRVASIDDTRFSLSIVVVFWVEKTDTIFAVRMEPSGRRTDAHGYSHLQFTRRIKLKDGDEPAFETDQEAWLPDSYPAFALGYEHPIHYFAGLAMSLHGFCLDDASKFASKAITKALEANLSRKLLAEMKRFFGRDWPVEVVAEVS